MIAARLNWGSPSCRRPWWCENRPGDRIHPQRTLIAGPGKKVALWEPPLDFRSMPETRREPTIGVAVPSSEACRGSELMTAKCEAELGTE